MVIERCFSFAFVLRVLGEVINRINDTHIAVIPQEIRNCLWRRNQHALLLILYQT